MNFERVQVTGIDARALADYEQMKSNLVLELIPTAGNEMMLSESPHRNMGDMALIYCFELECNEQGTSGVVVTDGMLHACGVTADRLHDDAMKAAARNRPATLRNIDAVIGGMFGDAVGKFLPDEPTPMWVASVEGEQNGACVIGYPGFLDQAAETLGGDFYILPSSVHEVLLVADDGSTEVNSLEEMVRVVNETDVEPAEWLSDTVYHYDSIAQIFENARAFEARKTAEKDALLADEPFAGNDGKTAAKSITVLMVEPNDHPKVIEIGTDLKEFQKAVGGYIEVVYPFDEDVGIVVNEEGKIDGLPLNRALRDENNKIYDVIAGTFLITGLAVDDFGSLTDEQIGKYKEMFYQPEVFIKLGSRIMAIPLPEKKPEVRENTGTKQKNPEHGCR